MNCKPEFILMPDEQKLLDKFNNKGKLNGHEIGRLFMLNALADLSGYGTIIKKDLMPIMLRLRGEQKRIYTLYADAFFAIDRNMNYVEKCINCGMMAYHAANKFFELVEIANSDYLTCQFKQLEKYKIENIDLSDLYDYRSIMNNCIMQIRINEVKLKMANIVFKIHGFENIINSGLFYGKIISYNMLVEKIKKYFEVKKNYNKIKEKVSQLTTQIVYEQPELDENTLKRITRYNIQLDNFPDSFAILDNIIVNKWLDMNKKERKRIIKNGK